jgi:HKD family nuclease
MGPASSALEAIRLAAQRFEGGRARIAVAWARDDGVARLFDAIGQNITRVEFLVGINERGTTVESLLRILQEQASLRVFFKHPSQTFHPKLYWFDNGAPQTELATIIVGSSNLTTGGLITNFEASIVAEIESGTITDDDRAFLGSIMAIWDMLISSLTHIQF